MRKERRSGRREFHLVRNAMPKVKQDGSGRGSLEWEHCLHGMILVPWISPGNIFNNHLL